MGSKDRLELESKVLAAALKQSHARGDTSGVSLAHKQIFLLLRQQQAQEKGGPGYEPPTVQAPPTEELSSDARASMSDSGDQTDNRVDDAPVDAGVTLTTSDNKGKKRKRVMPDIVWTEDEGSSPADSDEAPAAPVEEIVEVPAEESAADYESEPDTAQQPAGPEPLAEGDKPTFDAYGILAVEQIASFEEIHRHFLFHVRRVLMGLKKAKKKQRRPLLDELQNLWIAHDILSDPVTRTDFDFRILGLRGAPDVIIHSAPEDKTDSISNRTPLRIGELMQCAGLLEPTELEIAADMHKAMPEMLFGAFLVKQGFISEEDLGQVLMGQRLLKSGNLTVGHYQMCMKRWRENQTPIEETAVAEGLVTQQEMERVVASGLRDTSGVPAYQGGAQSFRASAPVINAEEAAKRNLSIGHAVPQWKDQLDWSEPEAIQEYVAEDRDSELRKPIENNLDIEGITDGVTKDSGKKSLRRLMEGIHSPDSGAGGEGGEGSGKSLKSILSLTSEPPMQGQVKVDRLAAPPPQEVRELAAEAEPAPEAEEQAPISAEQPQVSEQPPISPLQDTSRSQEETFEWASAQSVTQDRIQQVNAVRDMLSSDESPASPTVEMSFDRSVKFEQGAPSSLSDETTTEELAVKPDEPMPTTSRPTMDVPISKVMIEERSTKRLTMGDEDDDDVFGSVDYDDEDDVDLGFDVDEISPAAEIQAPPAEHTEQAPPATPPAEDAPVDMDDLLDFSTPPSEGDSTERSDIRKVLDEAFHGVRVPELPPQSPTPEEVANSSEFTTEAHFDEIAEEESHMESGVFPANVDMSEPLISEASLPVVSEVNLLPEFAAPQPFTEEPAAPAAEQQETGEPEHQKSDRNATEFSLPASILSSVEQNAPDASPEGQPEVVSETEEFVELELSPDEIESSKDEPVEPEQSVAEEQGSSEPAGTTVSMEVPPVVAVIEGESAGSDQSTDTEAVPKSKSITLTDVSMPAAARQKPQEAASVQEEAPVEQPQDEDEDTASQDPSAAEKEDPQARLKSGEWQIVYKLEGSLADVFLSEESEPEMPKLRPRLTEIDSIIPSSLTKITKGDADKEPESESKEESTKGDATKSGDKGSSDKPVIKPVSNNYYRDKGSKADKGKDGDKSGGKNKSD